MNHTTPDITPQQRANLQRLAAYLSTGQTAMRFDMKAYCRSRNDYDVRPEKVDECGTAGCAAGHGPAAGIPVFEDETWFQYSRRCFIDAKTNTPEDTAWLWCFAGTWTKTDNTPQGAAARINWMLTHGVPENWEAQMNGEAELCYA